LSASRVVTATSSTRRAPSLGGFNPTVLRLEIRRVLRNKRTLLMTIVLPVLFFLLFGVSQSYNNRTPADRADGPSGLGRKRGGLAGHLHRRSGLALPKGHGACLIS
jgi:hypothetical protein